MSGLHIISGVPGAGKTLFAIAEIEALRGDGGSQPKRDVYYYNIPGVTLDWIPLVDPKKWHECPNGAIVVMDEAQLVFRERSKSDSPPAHVAAFEVHRKSGHDVFLLSQHPTFIDAHVRKCTHRHVHLRRIFGTESATVFEWFSKCVDPNSKHEYKEARSKKWVYAKKYYGVFKSADVHNIERHIPWRQILLAGSIFAAVAVGLWWVFWSWKGQLTPESSAVAASTSASSTKGSRGQPISNPWAAEFRKPRILEVPNSAPIFDHLQNAVSEPSVAGCYQLKYSDHRIECRCNSWQGSALEMTVRQCMDLVRRGWFDPRRPFVDVKAENIRRLDDRDRPDAGDNGSQAPAADSAT